MVNQVESHRVYLQHFKCFISYIRCNDSISTYLCIISYSLEQPVSDTRGPSGSKGNFFRRISKDLNAKNISPPAHNITKLVHGVELKATDHSETISKRR
ncbi:hypothetical protein D3C87_1204060 [compost metagenome]